MRRCAIWCGRASARSLALAGATLSSGGLDWCARPGAARAGPIGQTVAIRVAVGRHQQAADGAVTVRTTGLDAFHQVPGQRLLTARGVKLLSDAYDRAPTKPTAVSRLHPSK